MQCAVDCAAETQSAACICNTAITGILAAGILVNISPCGEARNCSVPNL